MESIDKINLLLARNGMTGAELSRKIGVSNSVYSQWNTKITKPSNKSLSKISEFFNIDISEIMPDVEDPDEKTPADIQLFSANKTEMLMAAIDTMSKEELLDLVAKATEVLREK